MSDPIADIVAKGYEARRAHRLDEALEHYQQAVGFYRETDKQQRLAHNIRHVADILCQQSRFDEAAPLYEESIAIYRSHLDTIPLDQANALRGFALLKQRQAIALWREAGLLYSEAEVDAGVQESERRVSELS